MLQYSPDPAIINRKIETGVTIFGDFPNALSWVGIVVIVGSGLYIIYRERITARRATASAALTEAP